MTPQKLWQLKQRKNGNCQYCGRPSLRKCLCIKCRKKQNVKVRNRYRIKHGIPIDDPLYGSYGSMKNT